MLTVFGVLYAPGASKIAAFDAFSADGIGSGVFTGGNVDTLAFAVGLHEAHGVWVQSADGAYHLIVVGGPSFLLDPLVAAFPDGIPPTTAVTLVQLAS